MMSFDKNNPLHIYMREIGSIKSLTKSEEESLSRHVLAHDGEAESAGRRLVEAHLKLVVSIAERHFSARVDQLDLIQKGNDGLQQALSTFSGNSQGSFSGYAAICIEAAIAKAALESGSR
jgi:DNA-directed RNA polymerase sigma subunit (sigma70/sigma32)